MPRIHDAESVETLLKLWELCDRYARRELIREAGENAYVSEAHRHWKITGHPLLFGCCSRSDEAMQKLEQCLGSSRLNRIAAMSAAYFASPLDPITP